MATRHHRRRRGRGKTTDAPRHGGTSARPAGRALWSGSISFALLQIPVGLFPAERRSEHIRFRLLDKHDLSPIRNVRVNADSGKGRDASDLPLPEAPAA